MLFALPDFQISYIVMNRCLYLIGSWRAKLILAPLGMPKRIWPSMNQYRIFFVQTSTLPPCMHQKLTKHGRFCKQNNQLPTRSHDELEDNDFVELEHGYQVLLRHMPNYFESNLDITSCNQSCSLKWLLFTCTLIFLHVKISIWVQNHTSYTTQNRSWVYVISLQCRETCSLGFIS
jgi:hypothetical protein